MFKYILTRFKGVYTRYEKNRKKIWFKTLNERLNTMPLDYKPFHQTVGKSPFKESHLNE